MARCLENIGDYDLSQLCLFTSLLVSRGRDYAKEGEKDFARDIVRFVRNSRLLPILKAAGSSVRSKDLQDLEASLNWLALESHPEDVPDFKPDLAAIRQSLERLELNVAKLSRNETSFEESEPAGARSAPAGYLD